MQTHQRIQKVTCMERRVAGLVAQGLTNRQIAAQLGRSADTVKRHVSSLLIKLDASRRPQIAVVADREGWIADE